MSDRPSGRVAAGYNISWTCGISAMFTLALALALASKLKSLLTSLYFG